MMTSVECAATAAPLDRCGGPGPDRRAKDPSRRPCGQLGHALRNCRVAGTDGGAPGNGRTAV